MKRLPLLPTAYVWSQSLSLLLLFNILTLNACRSNTRSDLTTLEATSRNGLSSEELALNGSTARSLDKQLAASRKQIPFKHHAFIKVDSLATGHIKNPLLRLINSEQAWQQISDDLRLPHNLHVPINFATESLLVLVQTLEQLDRAVSISKLLVDTSLHVYLNQKKASSFCPQPDRQRPLNFVHLVKIARQVGENFAEDIKVHRGDVELADCSAQMMYAADYLSKLRSVPFTEFFNAPLAAHPSPTPRLIALSGVWGEWDLWLARHCPSCQAPGLPAGYPDHYILLAIIDGLPPTPRQGQSKLQVQAVYQIGNDLIIDVERQVSLCSTSSLNQGLTVIKLPRHYLNSAYAPPQLNIRLPYPFIKENQQSCLNKVPN